MPRTRLANRATLELEKPRTRIESGHLWGREMPRTREGTRIRRAPVSALALTAGGIPDLLAVCILCG
jgi:hypothetical protein